MRYNNGIHSSYQLKTNTVSAVNFAGLIINFSHLAAQKHIRRSLKEHCTQKKIWIHLKQNIFRNQTVKNLTILDNPFKRYDFSKFSLNSVKSLCRPHKLATVPCHGCTTLHWFCTQTITNFQFSWI